MSINQKTIRSSGQISGIGVHSGKRVTIYLEPAKSNTGIQFFRIDQNQSIKVTPNSIDKANRATILTNGQASISTPEHLLATINAFQITNLIIKITGDEVPILDGSAIQWVQLLDRLGVVSQIGSIEPITLKSVLRLSNDKMQILALPCSQFKVTYLLNYDEAILGVQTVQYELSKASFIKEIAPARTFGFSHELKPLLSQGLAQGVDMSNVLAIDGDQPFIYPDEPARHKILDIIGDFFLLGRPLHAHIIGIRSGHHLNVEMVKMIYNQLT